MSDTAGTPCGGLVVDRLLLEAGLDGGHDDTAGQPHDAVLRPVLLELRALAARTPEPSAAITGLMRGEAPPPHGSAPHDSPAPRPGKDRVDELAARRRAKGRIAVTALSVAVSLGAGGAVAAASGQGVRDSFSHINRAVTSFITGSGGAAKDTTGQPGVPGPAAPAAPAAVPAEPGPATGSATPAPAATPVLPADEPGKPEASGKAEDVHAPKTLPTSVPEDLSNGLGPAHMSVPEPSEVPLPGTLPPVQLR